MSLILRQFRSLINRLKLDRLRAQVAHNVGISVVVKLLSMTAGLLLQLVLARLLGVQEFGIYTFVWATFLTLSIVGRFGFELASIRFVSDYRAQGQIALLKGFIRSSRQIVSLVSAVLAVVVFLTVLVLQRVTNIDGAFSIALRYALPLLPLYSISELHVGVLRGGDSLLKGLATHNVLFPLAIVILILGTLTFSEKPTALTVIAVSFVALLLIVCLQSYFIHKEFSSSAPVNRFEFRNREWLSVATGMMFGSGIEQILRQLDVIVIGTFIGATASGIYSVAARFAKMVNLGLQISNQSTAHLYTPLHMSGKNKELQRVVSLTTLLTMLTTLPIAVVLFIWPSEILAFFGEIFSDEGTLILQILIAGQFVNVLSGPNGVLMQMTNYQVEMAWIQAMTLVFNLIALGILIPPLGVIGVAIATAAAAVVWNLAAVIRVHHHLGINSTAVSRFLLRG